MSSNQQQVYPPQNAPHHPQSMAQPQTVYVQGGCNHQFIKTGTWTGMDWLMCCFFFPFNFCCCKPGQQEKCANCGLVNNN
ncbi:hypothetical protein HDU88_003565 [Geranomyces variabilis]|nr:hypothetical protein HDU88_003565 [Geranomyces variabilis]